MAGADPWNRIRQVSVENPAVHWLCHVLFAEWAQDLQRKSIQSGLYCFVFDMNNQSQHPLGDRKCIPSLAIGTAMFFSFTINLCYRLPCLCAACLTCICLIFWTCASPDVLMSNYLTPLISVVSVLSILCGTSFVSIPSCFPEDFPPPLDSLLPSTFSSMVFPHIYFSFIWFTSASVNICVLFSCKTLV